MIRSETLVFINLLTFSKNSDYLLFSYTQYSALSTQ